MRISELKNSGFCEIGRWQEVDGALVLDLVETVRKRGAVYVFVDNDEIAYIGLSMMPLDKRLYFYARPGPKQSTNIRLKALILDRLQSGSSFKILAAFPGKLEWNGLSLDVAPGLETALINATQPKWNKRGSIKNLSGPAEKVAIKRDTPIAAGDPSHSFWIYVNDGRKRGCIHRAACGHCNHGQGKFGGGKRSNGYWKSFAEREEIYSFARKIGYPDIKPCDVCGG